MLSLCISDSALRDAILEQIAAFALPAPQIVAACGALIASDDTVWLIDEANYDPATLPTADAVILLLGGGDGGNATETDPRIAETFAKPLRLGHLMTRLRAWLDGSLRRDRVTVIGPYRLDPRERSLSRDGAPAVKLTEKEVALIGFLARQARPVARRDLLAEVWGYDERIDTHTLETHIYQLRRKLDAIAGDWLIFDQGGYRLAGTGAAS